MAEVPGKSDAVSNSHDDSALRRLPGMTTAYPTLSDDRHTLLCVSEVLGNIIESDGKNITGSAELAEKALRRVIINMGEAEDAGRDGLPASPATEEIQRRMDNLEDSYRNAPRITAGKLEDWHERIASLSGLITAAFNAVELLNRDERDATDYFGPLKAIEAVLEKAESEACGLSIVTAQASRQQREGAQKGAD